MAMKLSKRVFIGSALAASFLGSLAFFRKPSDPFVSGRPASAWTLDLLSQDYRVRGEAQTALLSLGEAGVQQIRVLLQKRAPAWQPYVGRFGSFLPFLKSSGPDPAFCRQRAAEI